MKFKKDHLYHLTKIPSLFIALVYAFVFFCLAVAIAKPSEDPFKTKFMHWHLLNHFILGTSLLAGLNAGVFWNDTFKSLLKILFEGKHSHNHDQDRMTAVSEETSDEGIYLQENEMSSEISSDDSIESISDIEHSGIAESLYEENRQETDQPQRKNYCYAIPCNKLPKYIFGAGKVVLLTIAGLTGLAITTYALWQDGSKAIGSFHLKGSLSTSAAIVISSTMLIETLFTDWLHIFFRFWKINGYDHHHFTNATIGENKATPFYYRDSCIGKTCRPIKHAIDYLDTTTLRIAPLLHKIFCNRKIPNYIKPGIGFLIIGIANIGPNMILTHNIGSIYLYIATLASMSIPEAVNHMNHINEIKQLFNIPQNRTAFGKFMFHATNFFIGIMHASPAILAGISFWSTSGTPTLLFLLFCSLIEFCMGAVEGAGHLSRHISSFWKLPTAEQDQVYELISQHSSSGSDELSEGLYFIEPVPTS